MNTTRNPPASRSSRHRSSCALIMTRDGLSRTIDFPELPALVRFQTDMDTFLLRTGYWDARAGVAFGVVVVLTGGALAILTGGQARVVLIVSGAVALGSLRHDAPV